MKKDLLSEELKKFQRLAEYDFYVPENYHDDEEVNLTEEDPEGEAQVDDSNTNGGEMGDDMGDDMGQEPEMGDEMNQDAPTDLSGEPESDPSMDAPQGPAPDIGQEPMDMGGEPEVELDVTQLVQGTEDAKDSADRAAAQIDQLMGKFQELENQLSNMNVISNKIEDLEREVEKRLPTEEEKLEMRSLDSYPYSQKLSDYWFDKEGVYDVMNKKKEEPEEYVLTPNDVNSDYNDRAVGDSLHNVDIDSDYEEEDVY